MGKEKKPVVTRNFMKNLSRGAVKSIPVGGALLEQVIYGTLDGEAAKKEAEKLHSALSQISDKLQGQDVGFGTILTALEKEAAFRAEVTAQIGQIKALLEDPDRAGIPDSLEAAIERILIQNLPYRSIGGLFKGREDVLEKLGSQLAAGKTAAITQVQAIHGLGGVGKTRLAVEYAWRALENGRYTAVLFVIADTKASLNTNLAALAGPGLLNLPEQNSREQPVIVEAVMRELGRRTGWLMIIDNVDSEKVAAGLHKEVLPRLSTGDVLITSRRSNWPDEVVGLPIDKLDELDAGAYLVEKTQDKRTPSDDDEKLAKQVAAELGGLPIALEQAAAYICQRHIGLGTYLEDLGQSREKVLAWHREDLMNYPVPVLATWQTSEEHLSPPERAILRLASFLAPEAIPTALFESQPEKIIEGAKLLPKESSPQSKPLLRKRDMDIRDSLAELAEWSMINLMEESFTIHRLVQDSIRLSVPEAARKAWCELALRLINDDIPAEPPPDDVRSWDLWNAVYSHVGTIAARADKLDMSELTTRLMNDLGLYLNTRARFSEAEPLMRRALAIDEKAFGKDHPEVAIDLNNLAQLLQDTNRLADAEPLMRRALAIDERSFGKDHPEVATDLNNLAELLRATNRLDEAEPMYRRALAIDEKSFGKEHPKVAGDLNNLALLLKTTNRLREAEPLMRRALAIDEKSFGKDHPEVAIDLNNLAALLQDTNRLAEAEPLMRRALAIFERSLGPDHPSTQAARENLEILK